MHIDFIDENGRLSEQQRDLMHKVLQYTGEQEKIPDDSELSILIVTNNEIADLNETYRNINEPTDVLSFPMIDWDEPFSNVEEETVLLGDIVISYDRAVKQAEQYGHSIERELAFLSVHGLLHLLGYTHDESEDEKKMFAKQEEILQVFQLER